MVRKLVIGVVATLTQVSCTGDYLDEHLHTLELELQDPYTLRDKQQLIAPGDFYWMNDVAISDADARRISIEITAADNFAVVDSIEFYPLNRPHLLDSSQVNNYRTGRFYVREYSKFYGAGYATLYLVGKLDTVTNRLRVEEIDP